MRVQYICVLLSDDTKTWTVLSQEDTPEEARRVAIDNLNWDDEITDAIELSWVCEPTNTTIKNIHESIILKISTEEDVTGLNFTGFITDFNGFAIPIVES